MVYLGVNWRGLNTCNRALERMRFLRISIGVYRVRFCGLQGSGPVYYPPVSSP